MAQCWYNTDAPLALSPVQTDATMLDVTCCVRLHTLLHVVACYVLLGIVAQSLEPLKLANVGGCCFRLHVAKNV